MGEEATEVARRVAAAAIRLDEARFELMEANELVKAAKAEADRCRNTVRDMEAALIAESERLIEDDEEDGDG